MSRNRNDAAPEREASRRSSEGVTKAQVIAYLRRHPEFLANHPELLDVLAPPSRCQGDRVVDLQRFMVERSRNEVERMRTARDELVIIGRNNLSAQSRVHKAALALLSARSFAHLIETITVDLAVILDVDVVTLCIERSNESLAPSRTNGIYRVEPGTTNALISPGRDLVLRTDMIGDPALFGAGAGLVSSVALIRLRVSRATPPAFMALGSRNADQFQPGQSTELLGFLARVLEHCIRAWLDLPD